MNEKDKHRYHVAVIGGGISGLVAAHRLSELDPSIRISLLEASDRLGGVLSTEQRDGCLIERAADMMLASPEVPWARQLCERIGLADALLPTRPEKRGGLVIYRGRLVPLPEGFQLMTPARVWPIVTTPLLSPLGKLRLACERFIPSRGDGKEESLAEFATRRFGKQAYERIIQPLVGGIYTADPKRLSVAAALPQFVQMEQEHGSLIRAATKRAKTSQQDDAQGARYGLFFAPRLGMSQMVDTLADRLPAKTVHFRSPIQSMHRDAEGRWQLERGDKDPVLTADAVIVALQASQASRLLKEVDTELAENLGSIPCAGVAIVVSAYHRDDLSRMPSRGFGCIVPIAERRKILAVSFASEKFSGRAPEDIVLLRTFVGGAIQPELTELDDSGLKKLVAEELSDLLGATRPPQFSFVVRWTGAMPQYHVGHGEIVEKVERRIESIAGLEIAGSAYHGVGIPHCIHSAEGAAQRIVDEAQSKN